MSDSGKRAKSTNFLRMTVFVAAAAAFIVGAGAAGRYFAEKKQNQIFNGSQQAERSAENIVVDDKKTIKVGGVEYAHKENLETLLIMGIDSADTQETTQSFMNTDQSDFNLLIVIDHDNKSYTSLALNRDTMTRVPALAADGVTTYWKDEQLALAHTYGTGKQDSCVNQAWAVSELIFGETVDHYISFSMPAIGFANTAVGGVTVTIEDDFSRLDPTLVQGETIKLNAQQAEHFVRGRKNMSDPTNLNRMSRQKTYMAAWKTLAIEKLHGDNTFFYKLLGMVSDYMISDMSATKLSDVSNQLAEYTDNGVLETEGTIKQGKKFLEYYVDEEDLRAKIVELYYEPV